jgi:DMSO/TMAO reductase YedYZ molybdopterin-dependent catalytic subunit
MSEPEARVPPGEEPAAPPAPGAEPDPIASPPEEGPPDEAGQAPRPVAEVPGEIRSKAEAGSGYAPAAPDEPDRAAAPGAGSASVRRGWRAALAEPPETVVEVPRGLLAARSRRDFLLFGVGATVVGALAWWLLPDATRSRLLPGRWRDRLDTLAARVGCSRGARERALDRALTFDDDVAEALYSEGRRVRTYDRSQVTPLRNNYEGRTPGPEYLADWTFELSGLDSGRVERLTIGQLRGRFPLREEVTRLVCVEGWSAVAWWGGIRFADLLVAFPPAPGARWAALRSDVNLDGAGRPDPYYVSIDLATARHPQTLLATHLAGQPLTVAHGAPLRLVAPMKLGLKNIKAITGVAYRREEPPDYWNERGYSKYDGL